MILFLSNKTTGLLFLEKKTGQQRQIDTAIALPVTLFPSKFPSKEYDYARSIQSHYNELIHSVANDDEFLHDTFKTVLQADDFTSRLWNIYQQVKHQNDQQVA
jgi:glutathione synthase